MKPVSSVVLVCLLGAALSACGTSSSSPASTSSGVVSAGGSGGSGAGAGGASAGGGAGEGGAGSGGGESDLDASVDAPEDSAIEDAPMDVANDVDKSLTCATTFGSSLTNAFGRLDGTVLAVVPPNDQACAMPNSTHLVIQVTVNGEAYRMVVDVLSTIGSPNVLFDEIDTPLVAGAWSEGWHPGVMLDYVATLGLHEAAFTPYVMGDLVAKITSEISLGDHISVFATSAGEPSSAHLVHRNATNADGAIVIHPEAATPHWLLCAFADQSF